MKNERNFILVDRTVLPEIFLKVIMAKQLVDSGEAKTINEAVNKAKLSRSAYYKYKDYVFPFNQMQGVLTLLAVVLDVKGVLSDILSVLSNANCNILTINQGVPLNGVANITITIQTDKMKISIDALISEMTRISGMRSVKILAQEDRYR